MEYKIGQKVRGEVTGIQPYGVFVALDDHTQGLIHISELKHGYVNSVEDLVKIGQKIDVMVMNIDEYSKKISLSVRSLHRPKYHPFSNRRKNPRYGKRTGVEFKSIQKKLPLWIDQALLELQDKYE